ncbi:hypothetical protein TTHERM_00901740 (macronuclear) [Tetrahymena thermophila SB210]|uniref:Zinc finger protein n=1 Tax=Tetrahymena thermophila (strain SB210) TaxID=312017 RepID=Q24GC5_TETTS|nr:hypothetical protein TTHERM_00901740 [Tetrahymena thermophila SB210]EAS06805.2 hypothetical protein TTHERM_00901740 [Tetrahymena thermophila SB210]|eukprot:XP_001027047.2 hypothetical protein TTHERM_00901740 [Tetrahymena thermophila SB210]
MKSHKGIQIIMNLIFLQYCLAQTCQISQIFDTLSQACLSCSPNCQNCFNISQNSCIGCVNNSYMSYDDISTCQNFCQKNEVIDSEGIRCIKCKVSGCVQCTSQQICLVCDENLVLDKNNNQCNAKKGICESDLQLLNPPFESRKCMNTCQQSYYLNYSSQICEYTQECPQIQQLSSSVINRYVNGIGIFKENQYITISGGSCSFAIVDQNWNIITKQTLQEINTFGFFQRQDETQIQYFLSGVYGGCLQGQRFNVMNFETLQIEFDEQNLESQHGISYIDHVNKLVFMIDSQAQALIWYDIQNKKINRVQLQSRYSIQLKIFSRYYIQSKEVNQLFVGTLQQDFSISLIQSKQCFSPIPDYILLQKQNYIISSTFDIQNWFYKLTFQQDGELIDQILILEIEYFPTNIFSYQSFNLVVQYDYNRQQLLLIQFNDTYDGVLINQVIFQDTLLYITVTNNQILNSYFILLENQNSYLFANLTDALYQHSYNIKQLVL